MLLSVGSVVPASLACAGGVLDDDKVGHAVPVSPKCTAADEELISASLAEDAGPVEADMRSLASWLPIRSRDAAASRDGGEEISGGMAAVVWSFFEKWLARGENLRRRRPWMTCQIVIMKSIRTVITT